jgi:hypothetical protein
MLTFNLGFDCGDGSHHARTDDDDDDFTVAVVVVDFADDFGVAGSNGSPPSSLSSKVSMMPGFVGFLGLGAARLGFVDDGDGDARADLPTGNGDDGLTEDWTLMAPPKKESSETCLVALRFALELEVEPELSELLLL